jgi:Raf kinase inhibitor-like YbhB/YbcL family protein
MRITADFSTIPDQFSKYAPEECKLDGEPIVSFPFYIEQIPEGARYLHWEFIDDDAIEVSGFTWIHWAVANVPLDALMYDFNDSHALEIPFDFSRMLPSMLPEASQGLNSNASKLVNETDPNLTQRYVGPTPPNKDHEYLLHVWASKTPLEGISQGFYLNQLRRAIRRSDSVIDEAGLWLNGRV